MSIGKQHDKESNRRQRKTILIIIIVALITAGIGLLVLYPKQDYSISFNYYGEYHLTVDEDIILEEGATAEIIWSESTLNACNRKYYDYSLKELDLDKEVYVVSHGKPIKSIYTTHFKNVKIYGARGRVLYIEFKDGDFPLKEYVYIIDNSNGPYCTEHEEKYLPH